MCKGSLATKQVLFQKYCVPSPICDRCHNDEETIIHALCDCPNIATVWEQHLSSTQLRDAPRTSVQEFLVWLYDHVSVEMFGSLCSTLWACWFVRNKHVFDGAVRDPIIIASQLNKLVEDYHQYNSNVTVFRQSHIIMFQQWFPPAVDWVKVNFDAHVGDNLIRGLGSVIRDHNGRLLAAGVRRFNACWDVETSEAMAALFGIELALRLGYEYIQLEGDAMNVVQAIEAKKEGCSPLYHIYDCISVLSLTCKGFGCSYVNRAGNTVAHYVARWDSGIANERICMNPFPQGLLTLAELDL